MSVATHCIPWDADCTICNPKMVIQKQPCEVCGAVLREACPKTHRSPYTVSVACAWPLLDELGGYVSVARNGSGEWTVSVNGRYVWGETAPLAICRAYHAALTLPAPEKQRSRGRV